MITDIEQAVKVLTKAELIARTEALVHIEGLGYSEAIIHICDEMSIAPEDIAKLVSGPLKNKLEAEAQRNNLLPRSSNSIEFI